MSSPFIGEIRIFAGNFAPQGWAFCQGQLMPISENDALFALIGTTYGGDGQETFALPNLSSRIPVHQGNGFTIGQSGGAEQVTLTTPQLPQHTHTQRANAGDGNSMSPSGAVPAGSKGGIAQYSAGAVAHMNDVAITTTGGNQPHDNMMPYICINYIISLFGIFPTQN